MIWLKCWLVYLWHLKKDFWTSGFLQNYGRNCVDCFPDKIRQILIFEQFLWVQWLQRYGSGGNKK